MPGPAAPATPPVATAVTQPRASANHARLRETARQFEAQMLGQMLQPIFATTDASRSRFGGGAGEAQWRPMMVDAYAQAASRRGGFGIADAVYRHMLRVQDAGRTLPR
ncbi:rod-binding protein [Plastoroseomonas arctica]|uniref:Chemotaxis protein chel n=1 Tax=Plastoroseomonas arctica TaxID=1509237 RepID=A0AAF1JYR9_9PROT|nr:rod-binding protein [Plastoroseomonas arctica]MBR0656185.1 chemotaxis protein chel [Plastoroseomonas arctica]